MYIPVTALDQRKLAGNNQVHLQDYYTQRLVWHIARKQSHS